MEEEKSANVNDAIRAELVRRKDNPDKKNDGGGNSIMKKLKQKIAPEMASKAVIELAEAEIAEACLEVKMLGLRGQDRPDETKVPVGAKPQVILVEHQHALRKSRQSDKSVTTIYRALKPHEITYSGYITNAGVRNIMARKVGII